MQTTCVRCLNTFGNLDHPLAHFSSICHACKEKSPETISDQQIYHSKQFIKNIPVAKLIKQKSTLKIWTTYEGNRFTIYVNAGYDTYIKHIEIGNQLDSYVETIMFIIPALEELIQNAYYDRPVPP